MSALADGRARAGTRPPRYRSLLAATLAAQITTGLVLWAVQLPFALLGMAPSSVAASLWLPWRIDGAWSALAVAGYVLVVCAVGGWMVAGRVAHRGIARPAPAWAWLAFGAAGYGAMALGHTGGARLLLAIVLAPLTLRLCAYRGDGSLRAWPAPLESGRRGAVPALLVAVALVLSYSAAHAFWQNGSGGVASATLRPGRTAVIDVGLHAIALPVRITGVALDGPGTAALGVARAAFTSAGSPPLLGDGPSVLPGPVARALPARLSAGTGAWLAIRIRLLSCPARGARIDAITLSYRVLGITTSQRIPLWSTQAIACRGARSGPSASSLNV